MYYAIVARPLGTTTETVIRQDGTIPLEKINDPRIMRLYAKGNIIKVTENNFTFDATVICVNKMYEHNRVVVLVS